MRCGWASTNLLPAPSGFRSRQPWSSRHPVREGNCLQFSALADLRREMSTKSNNNAAAVGACFWGRKLGVGEPVRKAGTDGARLFQLLCEAETAPDRRCRCRAAVPARPAAAVGRLPAASGAGNFAAISRSRRARAEALEI